MRHFRLQQALCTYVAFTETLTNDGIQGFGSEAIGLVNTLVLACTFRQLSAATVFGRLRHSLLLYTQ